MNRRHWLYALAAIVAFLAAAALRAEPNRLPAYRVEYVCFDGADELKLDPVRKTLRINCLPDAIFATSME
jgi:hypothetical protein